MPGSPDEVVLLDYVDGPNVFSNLLRRRPDGSEVWRATPPGSGTSAWVAARIEDGEVVAHSWSGFLVRMDLGTGTEIETKFTK